MIRALIYFAALIGLIYLAHPATAQQNPTPVNAAQIRQQIYQQCMAAPDPEMPDGQKKYCTCTAQRISQQITPEYIASLTAGTGTMAGKSPSQDDIGKAIQSDPRFMGIIRDCLAVGLGGK